MGGNDDNPFSERLRIIEGGKADGTSDELDAVPFVWIDPTKIPPREWLVGTFLINGYASLLSSTGGVGKTALAIALALSYITGRSDIIGLRVFQIGIAWLITLEDDRMEIQRRITAAMLEHNILPEQVAGKLFVNSGADRPVLIAKLNDKGEFEITADGAAIENQIRRRNIGLTIIDPLVKAHAVFENSNEDMDKLEMLANNIAQRTNTGMLLCCHARKGGENGHRDMIRGGGALVDGARIAKVLLTATDKEAASFELPPGRASQYIRCTDAKANLAPRTSDLWFRLASRPLGNGAVHPAYPAGDNIQVAVEWSPKKPFDGIDGPAMLAIFARLREGPEPGWFYSPHKQAKHWAGSVVAMYTEQTEDAAASVIAIWLQNDVLVVEKYISPKNRHPIDRVTLNESLVAEMTAGYGVS